MILSNWLDTNGQNARYVRAAERWGSDPDVLRVMALAKQDIAGVVSRFAAAASKDEELGLVLREAHRANVYMDFPGDILWTHQNDRMVRQLAKEADLIHLNNSTVAYHRLRLDQPSLLHHHGSLLRKSHAWLFAEARRYGMLQAVSTVDLMEYDPQRLHWLPTAYDGDMLRAVRKEQRRKADGLLRIVSCPTNPVYKSTEALKAAVAGLQAEGLPIELVLVEGQRWEYALRTKASADVVFDQVMFGYGCNGVEAMGMGIPLIAGGQPWTLAKMRELWGDLPFYVASETSIADAIRAMLDAKVRREYAAKGKAHFERFHAERPALLRLVELYHMAQEKRVEASPTLPQPVTFVNPKRMKVYHPRGEGLLHWPNGQLVSDDFDVVQRLRAIEAKRPRWGIREVAA